MTSTVRVFGIVVVLIAWQGGGSRPAAQAPEFKAVAAIGIEYKSEWNATATARKLVVGKNKPADYNLFEAVVTINNTQNQVKNLVLCTWGITDRFDDAFVRTGIEMTFDEKAKSLSCQLTQNQSERRSRFGQMGCRQITLAANEKARVVKFVSGNKRTTVATVNKQLVINAIGPAQDGERNADKIIAAGGAGAGGHPGATPNNIGGNRVRVRDAITGFVARFLLSDDAGVRLANDPKTFNCNKCFGMGSTIGDGANRTDFLLKGVSDDVIDKAKLKLASEYRSVALLKPGGRTDVAVDIQNEGDQSVLVDVTPTLISVPSNCTFAFVPPSPEPFPVPPEDSARAILQFDCDDDLPSGATADVMFTADDAATGQIMGDYWITGRNAPACDIDLDGDVDVEDVDSIMAYRNTAAFGPDDRYDVDHNGQVNVLDARTCTLSCTRLGCAP